MFRNIILLFGGDSNESLVSVASAQFMAQALPAAHCWFWAKNGALYEVSTEELISHKDPFNKEFVPNKEPIFKSIKDAVSSSKIRDFVFLLALHGGSGENGVLQSLLEDKKIPFTGSGSKASAQAFDKLKAKKILDEYHIRMAPDVLIQWSSEAQVSQECAEFLARFGSAILKPVASGSSVGCVHILSEADFPLAIEEMKKHPQDGYMLEKRIAGREITVGVVETVDGPRALPCTEILAEKNRVFDYAGKYLGQGIREVTPADLVPKMARLCQRVAIAAHAGLGLEGYSRTDLMVDDQGPVFLEINTLPGLTKTSLVPQQLAAAQITMREFLLQQIEIARKK